jgi:hypothetical protein
MEPSAAPSLEDRVEQLAREVVELRRRLVALERLVGTAQEHSSDRTVVQGKVSYDWQS